MSRLIDKLNQVSKALSQPMGFRAAGAVSRKPQMLLIASLTQTESITDLVADVASADAVLLHITKSSSVALQKIAKSLPDMPWGGWLGALDNKRVGTLVKSGCDFVVFPPASRMLAISQDDKIGKILQVESSLNEGLLKAVNELPVDAVLAADAQRSDYLTWQHLMLFQRFATLLTKPLLVSIPANTSVNDIRNLWEVGVDSVVVEVDTVQSVERIKELRQAIDELATLSPRKRKKTEALLPHISDETDITADTEEEEE